MTYDPGKWYDERGERVRALREQLANTPSTLMFERLAIEREIDRLLDTGD